MKIGILTFHRSINYGAVAQCYALSKRIQEDFPEAVVEVIDYVPQFRLDNYKVSLYNYIFGTVTSKNSMILNLKIVFCKILGLLRSWDNYKLLKTREKAFENSMSFLPLSKEKYRQNNVANFCESVKGKYDVIIVGSDCVWEWSTVPFPNAYYLIGDYGAKKMSFAASAGTDDFEKLNGTLQYKLREALEDFSYIGVRDTSTEYVLKAAKVDKIINHNCDPTTFLNMEQLCGYKERVRQHLLEAGIDFKKPIIGVMGNEKIAKLARDIFGDDYCYVALYMPNHLCDVNMLGLTVPEWMTIFSFFKLTFTTFFHGTMLSLVNRVPVLSFDYLPETEQQITKLHELYLRLDLPGFYHRGKRVYNEDDVNRIGEIARKLVNEPPTEQIDREIIKESQYYDSFYNSMKKLHENVGGNNDEKRV